MKKLLSVIGITLLTISTMNGQGLTGTFHLDGVKVDYTNVARDSGAAANDSGSTKTLWLSWPSAATPMFEYPVKTYATGDTVAVVSTPDILLTPQGLAYVGIDLYLTFNDDGTFQVPTSTYPTTTTVSCSTFAYIPTIQDAGVYEWNGVDENGGFGVVESNIFDWFHMDPMEQNNGWININRNTNGEMANFSFGWTATDGTDSGSGVDNDGNFDRELGITTLPSDQYLVAYMNSVFGTSLPVGTYPTAGDNFPDSLFGGTEASANWVYLFDPSGSDGTPFSGDELLQFTSYYFTYNDLAAIATFVGAFTAYYTQTGDLAASVAYAANATLLTFGCPSDVASGVSATVFDYVYSCLGGGGALQDCLLAGMVYTVGAAQVVSQGTWTFPNDADHDFNPTDNNGRLVFEMGNQCVPNLQTRVVYGHFYNTDPSVAIDEEAVPSKFALLGNYPNPFNPETNIAFELDKPSDLTITVYSILGEEVATLYNAPATPGKHSVKWHGFDSNGTSVPTGIYIYRIQADDRSLNGKMLLLK